MNGALASIVVRPLYGQVIVECEGASDLPVPLTGRERVIATSESVLIATRSDADGVVRIDVYRGDDDTPVGELVFDAQISCTTARLAFGSPLANQFAYCELGEAGPVALKIYVDPPNAPSRVFVFVDFVRVNE